VFADNRVNDTNGDVVPSWHLTAEHLARYSLVILPGVVDLPDWTVTELDMYEAGGGTVVVGSPGSDQAREAAASELLGVARAASLGSGRQRDARRRQHP
jgi:hypothetical protein